MDIGFIGLSAECKARKPTERPLGSVDHCTRCGKEYTVTGGRQKYCPDCADEAVREVDRKQAIEHYKSVKEAENPVRNEKRRLGTKTCVICGREFPCDGTVRNTCSPECAQKQKQSWQKSGDLKRKKSPVNQ